jgi:hypothetical protein
MDLVDVFATIEFESLVMVCEIFSSSPFCAELRLTEKDRLTSVVDPARPSSPQDPLGITDIIEV